jgi:hypothetical protein
MQPEASQEVKKKMRFVGINIGKEVQGCRWTRTAGEFLPKRRWSLIADIYLRSSQKS